MSRAKRQRQKENTRQAREAREAAQKRQKRKSTAIRVVITVAVAAVAILAFNLIFGDDDGDDIAATDPSSTTVDPTATTLPAAVDAALDPAVDYSAKITTNLGEIVVDLDEEAAPIGTAHFVTLAKDGIYDGSRWHRIGTEFMIQGGAPGGDPAAPFDRSVVAEVPTDNYPEGSIAAAKTDTDEPGTFTSQFFITSGPDGAALPNEYARFGMVTSGMDVVQALEALAPEGAPGEPTGEATIVSIEIVETPKPTDVTATAETTVAP